MRDISIVILFLVFAGAVLLVAAPTVSEFLVRARSRRLRSNFAIRLEEEWLAELKAIPNRASKLTFAIALTLTRRKAFGLPVEDIVFEFHDRPSLFTALSGWKSLLIIPTAVFALAAYGMSFLLPVRYASEVVIMERPAGVSGDVAPNLTVAPLAQQMKIIRQTILSRTSLLRLIREFELYDSEISMEERVKEIRNNITITEYPEYEYEAGRNSAFTIRFVGANPIIVQQVVTRLVHLFIEQNNQVRQDMRYGTIQFLQGLLDDIAKRLAEQGKVLGRERADKEQVGSSVHALEYEILQARYKTVFDKLEDARLTEYMDGHGNGEQFVIVDPPFLPDRPIGPNRQTIAAVGALAGCVFGLIAMAGLSRRRRRLLA